MSAMSVAQRMTADEFLRLPPDESAWTRELIDGEVVVNAPSNLHQYVLRDLVFALESSARARPGRGRASLPLNIPVDVRNVWGRGDTLTSPLLPGFELALDELFGD